jgi:predicted TIM-barrel enzyme
MKEEEKIMKVHISCVKETEVGLDIGINVYDNDPVEALKNFKKVLSEVDKE